MPVGQVRIAALHHLRLCPRHLLLRSPHQPPTGLHRLLLCRLLYNRGAWIGPFRPFFFVVVDEGFAKFKKIHKSTKNWMELTSPTHPPMQTFFCISITDMNRTFNILKCNVYIQIYTWYVPQSISTDIGLFWDDFQNKMPSETLPHPPTLIVISDFWNLFYFAKPLNHSAIRDSRVFSLL